MFTPSDLIPSSAKVVRPISTRFGERWFAVYVKDRADGLVSVEPTFCAAIREKLNLRPTRPVVALALEVL